MLAIGVAALAPLAEATPRIIERTTQPDDRRLPEMVFFLRLPDDDAAKPPGGVLAYCTWLSDPETIRGHIEAGGDDPTSSRMIAFARRHNLAVLTWTARAAWDSRLSADELDDKQADFEDMLFDALSREWRLMAGRLATTYDLPKSGWLLFGVSRGAQWAHRLALREPRFFKAVHIAINSSYDAPTRRASGIWWLATTGELETGYPAALRWYRQCLDLDYQIVFRAAPNTGHEMTDADWDLGAAFFAYALAHDTWRREFAADMVNHIVVPAARADSIPETQRTWLPDRAMATTYGELIERQTADHRTP